jgi:hypothetical protein
MKIIKDNYYKEIILGLEDINDLIGEESLAGEIMRGDDPTVINIKRIPVLGSEQIMTLIRLITELCTLGSGRVVILCCAFMEKTLRGLMGRAVSVFISRTEMEVAVRQEVASTEKEMLWQ